MANTQAAKKAVRVSEKRRKINLRNKQAFREVKKKINELLQKGEVKDAKKLLPKAYQLFDFAAKKGTIHSNTASRYKSRLAQAVKKADQ